MRKSHRCTGSADPPGGHDEYAVGTRKQLQALLTLAWSALLFGGRISASTVAAAVAVIVAVVWSQRGRGALSAAPQE